MVENEPIDRDFAELPVDLVIGLHNTVANAIPGVVYLVNFNDNLMRHRFFRWTLSC